MNKEKIKQSYLSPSADPPPKKKTNKQNFIPLFNSRKDYIVVSSNLQRSHNGDTIKYLNETKKTRIKI